MKVKVRTGNSLKVEAVRGECGTTRDSHAKSARLSKESITKA